MTGAEPIVSADLMFLSDSDRFVANWLVDRITALPDETHEKLIERLAIQEESSPRKIWKRLTK